MTLSTSFSNRGLSFIAYVFTFFVMIFMSHTSLAETTSGEVFHVDSKSMSAVERGEEISFLKSTKQDLQGRKAKAQEGDWSKRDEILLTKIEARLQLLERDQNSQVLSKK